MSRNFQPVLFVTTNAAHANEFAKLENLNSSFLDVLKKIPHDDSVLLSPLKNKQYFQSFDYNVGYDRAEMFSINLQFVDVNQSFEDAFLKFIFNSEKYRYLVNEYIAENKITNNFSKQQTFNSIDRILQNKFQGFTYFVFGINDRCSSPIISQYRRCEVTQTSEGPKKIKINFQNLGHPHLVSDLSQLNLGAIESKSEAVQIYNNTSYVVKEAYTVSEEKPDIVKLAIDKKLNTFIKTMLKKLFVKITGGSDVLLLLPDFDKLYEKFSATWKPPSRIFALKQFDSLKASTPHERFIRTADFFRYLGFNVNSNIYEKLKEKDEKIPEEARKKLEDFQKQLPTIKEDLKKINFSEEQIKNLLVTNVQTRQEIIDLEFARRRQIILDEAVARGEPRYGNETSIKKIKELYTLKDNITKRLNEHYINLTNYVLAVGENEAGFAGNFYGYVDTYLQGVYRSADENIFGGITQEKYAGIIADDINEDLKELVIEERFGDKQIDYEDPDTSKKIDDKPPFLEFSIAQDKNGDISTDVLPVKRNAVNLYKFFAQFSTSIATILGEFDVRIGCYEENDISRLKILYENCEDYSGKFVSKDSGIYTKPLLIIADEFILKNLFNPITTLKQDWKDYPISNFDIEQFGPNSKYFSEINEFRKRAVQKNTFLNSSFDESLASDALDILNNEKNKEFLPTLTIPNIPIFVGNHSRGNITSYTAEVDKQNHLTSYRALITYMKNSIITESLRPIRRSIYEKLMDYDKFKSIAVEYFSQGNLNIEILKEKITKELTLDNPKEYPFLRNLPNTPILQGILQTINSNPTINPNKEFIDYLVDDILLDIINNTKSGVSHIVETKIRLNVLTKKKILLQELYKKLFKLSIKTLPFFDVCNLERLYSGAFVILKNIKPSVPNFKSDEEYNYLTGFYLIKAYKHVITPTSCYSEFTLIKSIDIGGIEV